nr:MAG: viral protein kinase [Peromyscus leucopus gammaherpesvirus]
MSYQMSVVETKKSKIILRIPEVWRKCHHMPIPKGSSELGSGGFGYVRAVNERLCVKHFKDGEDFYREVVNSNLVAIASSRFSNKGTAILNMINACAVCKFILYPRLNCNLHELSLRDTCPDTLANAFVRLQEGVMFLNREVGLFHGDISPSNILVRLDPNTGKLDDLILADLGISVLHSGNSHTDIVVKSTKGKQLVRLDNVKSPYYLGKDAYKPAFVLFICYTLRQRNRRAYYEQPAGLVNQREALAIDLCSLGYSLLACIRWMFDLPSNNLPAACEHGVTGEPQAVMNPVYYLLHMIDKVAMCQLLNASWETKINLGVTPEGECTHLELCPEHRNVFSSKCRQFVTQYMKLILDSRAYRHLRSKALRDITVNLLSYDCFSENGM